MFDVVVACLVLTTLFAYLNHRYVRLPTTIGVMVIALFLSLILLGLAKLGLTGLQVTIVAFAPAFGFAIVLTILITLGARLVSVALTLTAMRTVPTLPRGGWKILVWGGLRGGISVALALSLPASAARDLIVTLTYSVVVFSIIVQGASMGAFTRRALTYQ